MASSTLEAVPAGAAVFIDAPVFIYHFTGASRSCRDFLARCELGEVHGATSAVTLRTLLLAGELRPRTGLLTNDSLVAATARDLTREGALTRVASADPDFESVDGLTLHRPSDL